MRNSQNGKQKQRLKTIRTNAEALKGNVQSVRKIWVKHLEFLENSLKTMRDELFMKPDRSEVSITGQILIESVAERAAKLTKEVADHHRTMHVHVSKIGKNVERFFDKTTTTPFKGKLDLTDLKPRRQLSSAMIYDFAMCNGLTATGIAIKEVSEIDEKYDVKEPDTLQQIVSDLRDGEIGSSLDFLETNQPAEERLLRNSLQTQMITDCIELGLDNYDRAVGQLKRFRSPFADDRRKALHLIGALLVGKSSMQDSRYRYLFDYANREILTLKMASFFIPYEAPLKNLMRYGMQAMIQLGDLFTVGYGTACMVENELPIEIAFNVTHSAFNCPILKEQCSMDNPPMRLVCGHVISRDAINRLTTSVRQQRSNPRGYRHSRFKCPYCPREQYIDTAKKVELQKWFENSEYRDEEVQLFQFFN